MVNIAIAKQMMNYYLDVNTSVFLWGPPGVGKSQAVAQIVKERKWAMIDFRAILRDPVDLRGVPVPDPKTGTTKWFTPDDLPNEKRDGKHGILFLDELNAANMQVQAACFGLVLDRKLGDYKMPAGWRIIAAGNRQSDRSAAQRMARALSSRFAHIDVEADAKQWIADYGNDNCDELVVDFIRFRPQYIHDMNLKDPETGKELDERTFPNPRTWAEVSKVCRAPEHLRYHLVKSHIGSLVAGEFESFIRVFSTLPDIDDVIAKPKSTFIPDEMSAKYAIAGALSRFADRGNFENCMIYAGRLGRELEIIVGMEATRRDATLTKTKTYIEFTKRNKDLQIGNFRVN